VTGTGQQSRHMIYLALGSNLGNRSANLGNTISSLPPEVDVLRQSPVYETPPWGYQEQPAFLNMVVEAQTDLPPVDLLVYLKGLEVQLGRLPTFNYGPRLIDIDILLYAGQIFSSPELMIPHPRMSERAFVLVPLADLAPDLHHPVTGMTVSEMLAQVDRSEITRFDPDV
jgi:2-amino-4-hydroxy-6-hydroxymethyldihydropteridine diphosphokinase